MTASSLPKFKSPFSQKTQNQLLTWAPFILLCAYFWRTYNIFTQMPAFGDALEVIWGINWYQHAITTGTNPLQYPFVFHPEAWQVGTLAHTPVLYLLAQPFNILGGEIFAYNMLAIIPFFISYIGALKFFSHYTNNRLTLTAVALAYTFVGMRSSRVWGHLHILWGTSFLPFLGHSLMQWRNLEPDKDTLVNKCVIQAGVYWGLMITFSLYSIFLAPLAFLLLFNKLFGWKKIPQFVMIAAIAIMIGLPAIGPYLYATSGNNIQPSQISELVFWGASANSLFIPNVFHSIPVMKQLADFFYTVRFGGESRSMNMGLSSLVLLLIALYGVFQSRDKRPIAYGSLLTLAFGIVMAMGPLLKWNGQVVEWAAFEQANQALWSLGHWLKPDVFRGETVFEPYRNAVPLPGYVLLALVPKLESARTIARFILVAFLGLLGLIALAFDHLPQWLRLPIMLFWLVEMLPIQTEARLFQPELRHPAHEWLVQQPLAPHEGIVDVQYKVLHSPEILHYSWQTKRPTASAIGSFLPESHLFLVGQTGIFTDRPPEDIARILQSYGIRYIFIHRDQSRQKPLYEHLRQSPDLFNPVNCFDGVDGLEPYWNYPICVVEVLPHPVTNIFPVYGLSDPEPWGMWSIEDQPRFNFVGTANRPHLVDVEAFPHCVDGKTQTLEFFVGETSLYQHTWENCDPVQFSVTIPQELVKIGFNEARFKYGYALSPAELETGNDPRKLAVGFSKLSIRPQN